MNLEQLHAYHSDDTMEPLDVRWEWVQGARYGFWRRDEHYEALKALRNAGMLSPEVVEELSEGTDEKLVEG